MSGENDLNVISDEALARIIFENPHFDLVNYALSAEGNNPQAPMAQFVMDGGSIEQNDIVNLTYDQQYEYINPNSLIIWSPEASEGLQAENSNDASNLVPVEEIRPSIPRNVITEAYMDAMNGEDDYSFSQFKAARLQFTTQPKKFYKYCFKCDIQKKSGSIVANNSAKNKKLYPQIECILPNDYAGKIFLHIDLYEKLEGDALPRVSAHLLVRKAEEIDAKPVCLEMTRVPGGEIRYSVELRDIFIMRTNKDRRRLTLQSKYEELEKWIHNQEELSSDQKNLANNRAIRENEEMNPITSLNSKLYIGARAYIEKDNRKVEFSDLVYSNAMFCAELKINEIKCKRGSIEGGTRLPLTLSVDLVEDPRVIVQFKFDGDSFELEASMDRDDVQKNVIYVMTPKLTADILVANKATDEIICEIYLRRMSDNVKSNKVKYVYEVGYSASTTSPKRIRRDSYLCTDSASSTSKPDLELNSIRDETAKPLVKDAMQKLSVIAKLSNKAEELEKLNADYMEYFSDDLGNSIYHDAIATGDFLKIYKMCESLPLRPILAKVVNKQGENLLHYACKYNASQHIRPLCNLGATIYTQNKNKETPLHVALRRNAHDCIQKFESLLCDIKEYTDILEAFKWMLRVYNTDGETVLHLAVTRNRLELVKSILRLCEDENIDPMTIETLGKGNTILHLAVETKSVEMIGFILETIPNAADYGNYAGEKPIIPSDYDRNADIDTLFEVVQNAAFF